MAHFLHDGGSGVKIFIDSMTETVHQLLLVFDVFDKLRDVLFFSNRLEHSQDSLVGSSMLRSIKCSSGSCDRSVDVNS